MVRRPGNRRLPRARRRQGRRRAAKTRGAADGSAGAAVGARDGLPRLSWAVAPRTITVPSPNPPLYRRAGSHRWTTHGSRFEALSPWAVGRKRASGYSTSAPRVVTSPGIAANNRITRTALTHPPARGPFCHAPPAMAGTGRSRKGPRQLPRCWEVVKGPVTGRAASMTTTAPNGSVWQAPTLEPLLRPWRLRSGVVDDPPQSWQSTSSAAVIADPGRTSSPDRRPRLSTWNREESGSEAWRRGSPRRRGNVPR